MVSLLEGLPGRAQGHLVEQLEGEGQLGLLDVVGFGHDDDVTTFFPGEEAVVEVGLSKDAALFTDEAEVAFIGGPAWVFEGSVGVDDAVPWVEADAAVAIEAALPGFSVEEEVSCLVPDVVADEAEAGEVLVGEGVDGASDAPLRVVEVSVGVEEFFP